LNNEVALSEIVDILNMRYADLDNWDWHAGEEGVPVLSRQQLNGKYRVWMDDDILETIFVEHICVQVCNKFKGALTSKGKKVRWQVVLESQASIITDSTLFLLLCSMCSYSKTLEIG